MDTQADWRARALALEEELAERAALANEALAAAQDRTYWLDRLHLDLNALMARPLATRVVRLLPVARQAYRGARRVAQTGGRVSAWRRSLRAEAEEDEARAAELAGAGSVEAVSKPPRRG